MYSAVTSKPRRAALTRILGELPPAAAAPARVRRIVFTIPLPFQKLRRAMYQKRRSALYLVGSILPLEAPWFGGAVTGEGGRAGDNTAGRGRSAFGSTGTGGIPGPPDRTRVRVPDGGPRAHL